MDSNSLIKIVKIINELIPGINPEVHSLADLTDSPNQDIRELCETAMLIARLSKEENAG